MQTASARPAPLATAARSQASVRNLSVSLFASVMGIAGLALAWRLAHAGLGVPAVIGEACGAVAVIAFLVLAAGYLVKLAMHPDAVRAEFLHPVAGNFFGTIAISLLLLSSVIEPYGAFASQATWTAGVLTTFVLAFVAVSRLLKGQLDASLVMPAWIIPCVATLDIPVTGSHMPMAWAAEVNLLACAIGSVMALVLFALIVSRLVHHEPLAAAARPSMLVLVAPFAVGFLAYSNVSGGIDRFGALLFYFGLFMFVVLAPMILRPGSRFSASWWAIGFPLAALAIAALRYAAFRATAPLWVVAIVLLGLLSLAIAVLSVQTVRFALNGKLFS